MSTGTTEDNRPVGSGAAQPVYEVGTARALAAGAATSAKQDTGNTSLASIDGKLPASPATTGKQDTGNTSLASIDTKLPAPGQALAAASTPVVLPAAQITTLTPPTSVAATTYATPATGELQGSTSALQLPNIACKLVRFRGRATNSGNVYLGVAGVTVPDGTTDTTTGFSITPGADTGWIPVANLNEFYRICDNATDALTYMALN